MLLFFCCFFCLFFLIALICFALIVHLRFMDKSFNKFFQVEEVVIEQIPRGGAVVEEGGTSLRHLREDLVGHLWWMVNEEMTAWMTIVTM